MSADLELHHDHVDQRRHRRPAGLDHERRGRARYSGSRSACSCPQLAQRVGHLQQRPLACRGAGAGTVPRASSAGRPPAAPSAVPRGSALPQHGAAAGSDHPAGGGQGRDHSLCRWGRENAASPSRAKKSRIEAAVALLRSHGPESWKGRRGRRAWWRPDSWTCTAGQCRRVLAGHSGARARPARPLEFTTVMSGWPVPAAPLAVHPR
jgi:hypothetical protein